ncbi:hypothetical protein ACQP2P_03030 [Dactylosporangium sp. CA-139114]|uniref:hypothetical protein n=1 Tax=Dactylosporangium sp. CA-139114 TaxID=3239931 RepID=UPI003D96E72F
MREAVAAALSRGAREGRSTAVLLVGPERPGGAALDDFDELMRRSVLRDDPVGRVGEEFAAVLHIRSVDNAEAVARRIAVAGPARIGIAVAAPGEYGADDLLQNQSKTRWRFRCPSRLRYVNHALRAMSGISAGTRIANLRVSNRHADPKATGTSGLTSVIEPAATSRLKSTKLSKYWAATVTVATAWAKRGFGATTTVSRAARHSLSERRSFSSSEMELARRIRSARTIQRRSSLAKRIRDSVDVSARTNAERARTNVSSRCGAKMVEISCRSLYPAK